MIDPSVVVCAVAVALLVGCSAFFSLSETAYTNASAVRLRAMINDGNRKAEKALAILEDYDRFLATNLIGNNFVNVASAVIATAVSIAVAGILTGSVVAVIVMTVAVLILGEVIPKTYAKRRPESCAVRVATAVGVMEKILYPVAWAVGKLTDYVSDRTDPDNPDSLTEEELEEIIDEIEEDGVIEKEEGELIRSALRFDDTPVSEVFTPRVDLVAVDVDSDSSEVGAVFSRTRFSRIPVYEGSIDNIVGVLYSKDFFISKYNGREFTIRSLMKPVKYVPETMNIAAILSDFQKTKVHMAVVLDSYGGTTGVVTLEDILEELVGDIWDESDDVVQDMVAQRDGTWVVKGSANIFDVMERLEEDFDPGEYDDYSVNGYVFHRLGRAPVRGDTVETGNVTIVVRSVKGRRALDCVFSRDQSEPAGSD